jgi:hypothetical protein
MIEVNLYPVILKAAVGYRPEVTKDRSIVFHGGVYDSIDDALTTAKQVCKNLGLTIDKFHSPECDCTEHYCGRLLHESVHYALAQTRTVQPLESAAEDLQQALTEAEKHRETYVFSAAAVEVFRLAARLAAMVKEHAV